MVGGSRVTLPCVRRWFGMREPGSSYLALPLPPGSSSGVAFGGNGAEFDNPPRGGSSHRDAGSSHRDAELASLVGQPVELRASRDACVETAARACLHGRSVVSLSEAWGAALRLLWHAEPDVVQAAWTSLYVSFVATIAAALAGVPFGLFLARCRFPGRSALEVLVKTLTAMPTVVVGLLFYVLLSRSGPFGVLGLLYTPAAMILGQAALVFPLVAALTLSLVVEADPRIEATAKTLGASRTHALLTLLFELRYGIVGIVVTVFGRLLSELGVALMLGGNIRGSTRTLTTAIALETSKGDFALAFALGLLLLSLALAVNVLAWWASPRWLP